MTIYIGTADRIRLVLPLDSSLNIHQVSSINHPCWVSLLSDVRDSANTLEFFYESVDKYGDEKVYDLCHRALGITMSNPPQKLTKARPGDKIVYIGYWDDKRIPDGVRKINNLFFKDYTRTISINIITINN